jgi:hypothetical protein
VLALAAVLRAIERSHHGIAAADDAAALPAERTGAATEWPRPAPIAPPRAEGPQRERAETPLVARPPWSWRYCAYATLFSFMDGLLWSVHQSEPINKYE